jgi:hypothetical protein
LSSGRPCGGATQLAELIETLAAVTGKAFAHSPVPGFVMRGSPLLKSRPKVSLGADGREEGGKLRENPLQMQGHLEGLVFQEQADVCIDGVTIIPGHLNRARLPFANGSSVHTKDAVPELPPPIETSGNSLAVAQKMDVEGAIAVTFVEFSKEPGQAGVGFYMVVGIIETGSAGAFPAGFMSAGIICEVFTGVSKCQRPTTAGTQNEHVHGS